MKVRQAQTQDISQIVGIWNAIIRDTTISFSSEEKTPDEVAGLIAQRGGAFVTAVDGATVLGFATYFPFRGGTGYRHTKEHTILLAPEARGRGAGRALMTAIEDHARTQDVHVLVAVVSAENAPGLAFHTAVGFEEVGRMPQTGRKFGRWLDSAFLQKFL